jgi:hypothetical protein
MDSIVFEESVNTEVSTSEFVDKQWLYVNDNNNGSYSSQIVLDTTPLSNSGAYINWSEAFMLIPLVLQIESASITAAGAFDYIAGLKNGYWNILHSLTCEFNNGNVIQQVPFLNVFCSFKNLTSWSLNDLTNWGDVCGFHKDTSRSWCFQADAPASNLASRPQTSGTGLANNRNSPYVSIQSALAIPANQNGYYNVETQATLASDDMRSLWNEGLFERQNALNYDEELVAVNSSSSNKGVLMDGGNAAQIFRSYVRKEAGLRWYAIDAVIRLKDVADFFHKCPLLKGSTMRIYLNTNQCFFQVGMTGAQYANNTGVQNTFSAQSLVSAPVILGGGGTNPCMVASCDVGQGSERLVPLNSDANNPNTATVSVGLSIVRTQFSQLTNQNLASPLTSVRLYAPAYTFNPISEQRYLSLTPTKKVIYNDIFQFSFSNQPSNSPFNILVTNGIPNIRSVLVIPLLPRASNGQPADNAFIANSQTSSTLLSPFTSTGATPDPISITNFQIQVSGKNLFINQMQYDYETFCEQLVSSNQLNGSLTTSMTSGLISKSDFQSLYRFYYGNASRSLPSEDGVAKAIQISGTIQTPTGSPNVNCDLMVFVEFEREIVIDVRTGARVA